MLEVPVACAVEELQQKRSSAVLWIGGLVTIISGVIVLNFSSLFGLVINFTTVYSQPIIALLITLIAGWIWNRNQILSELKQGCPDIENSLFWKIWPWYVRLVCPVLMLMVFLRLSNLSNRTLQIKRLFSRFIFWFWVYNHAAK